VVLSLNPCKILSPEKQGIASGITLGSPSFSVSSSRSTPARVRPIFSSIDPRAVLRIKTCKADHRVSQWGLIFSIFTENITLCAIRFVNKDKTIWFTAMRGINAGFRFPFYLIFYPVFTKQKASSKPFPFYQNSLERWDSIAQYFPRL
jgi:hypothetical protein